MNLTFPLSEKLLVLTVNNRLKRHLEFTDAEARKNAGQTIWPTAPIFPFNHWLKETYQSAWPDKWILSALQSQTLWESILESDPEFIKLDPLSLKGAAKDSAKAYSLLHQFEILVTEKSFSGTEESRAFFRWKTAYEAALTAQDAIDSGQVMNRVSRMIASGEIMLPEKIILAGFDEINPALNSWIKAVEKTGNPVQYFSEANDSNSPATPKENGQINVRRFNDTKTEVIQCTRWIRSQYKQGHRIGIVATRLEEVKNSLERELMAELAPESIFPWDQTQLPFNVSLGQPLIQEPMFPPVLTFLASPTRPVPIQELLQVVRSPFLVPEHDDENVADELETRLIRRKIQDASIEVIRKLTQPASGKTQKTSRQYKNIKTLLAKWLEFQQNKKYQSRKLPSEWARIFAKILFSIGWPAKLRQLNAREIQAYLEWESRLDELSSLDPILRNISRVDAAQYLFSMVANPTRPFQEQTTEDSPIQLMGLLESSGQAFDSLWVMGCDADILPEPLRPNPFIPTGLQRKLEMPYASPERQCRFARNIITRLVKSSNNIVFSYSIFKDKEPKRVSPLLSDFAEADATSEISHRIKDRIPTHTMEAFTDNVSIPIPQSALPTIQGGFRILKNQGECPFRAFSIHRLLADRYQVAETDFDQMDRGNIIHLALELIWKSLQSRAHLEQLTSAGTLEELIRKVLQDIMAREEYSRLFKTQSQFKTLEVERLTQLISSWLKIELDRSDFKVVALERKDKFNFEGLTINYRADRIDQLPDGQQILIDYKSGKVVPKAWFKEPIRDPQLPLYATHLNPDAIALAQIKKGEMKIHTTAAETFPLDGLTTANFQKDTGCENWDQLRAHWDRQLRTQARNFIEGEMEISPVENETTCRNCHHASLCRVEELNQRLDPHS